MAAAEAVDRTDEHYSVEDVGRGARQPDDRPRPGLARRGGATGRIVAHAQLTPRAPYDGSLKVDDRRDRASRPPRPGARARTLVPLMVTGPASTSRERGDLHAGDRRHRAVRQHRPGRHLRQPRDCCPHRWNFLMEADLSRVEGDRRRGCPTATSCRTWEGIDHDEMRAAHNVAFVGPPRLLAVEPRRCGRSGSSETRNSRPALSLVARDVDGRRRGVRADQRVRRDLRGHRRPRGLRGQGRHHCRDHRRRGLAAALLRLVGPELPRRGLRPRLARRRLGEPDRGARALRVDRLRHRPALEQHLLGD